MQLSKQARDIAHADEATYIRFEDGLDDEIEMLVGALEIRELAILVDRHRRWRKYA